MQQTEVVSVDVFALTALNSNRLDFRKSGKGLFSCCRLSLPHTFNSAAVRRFFFFGRLTHFSSVCTSEPGVRSDGGAGGSCSLPGGRVTLTGVAAGSEVRGVWRPESTAARCERAASALTSGSEDGAAVCERLRHLNVFE